MATKAPKKTTAKKPPTTIANNKSTDDQVQDAVEAERSARSCAFPSCSARETKSFPHPNNKDLTIPSCDAHADIFENQANDGAGIQQLMENYRG